jgi:ribulose-5-phosphate 4-epimerase/fuculose-1-phosphate aldolase
MVCNAPLPEATYVGVKFRTEMVGRDLPTDPRIQGLSHWCKVFHETGLAPPYAGGSYGNLSFRLKSNEPSFVITAAKSGLADSVSPDRFVTVDRVNLENGIVYARGQREPSSESMVHAAIYDLRPEVEAIFHGHSDEISKNAERLGIPITSREEPYGTVELVKRVQEILGNHRFIEMRNHGFISLGKEIAEAGFCALGHLRRCNLLG